MNTPFEKEISRGHLQRLVEKDPDIAREYTIPDLLHKIDPSASLDPLAEELMLDVADDFIDTVVCLAAEVAKSRGGQSLQAEDISYVVQRKFGDVLGSRRDVVKQHDFMPNEAHIKRQKAVLEHSKNPQ